MMIPRQAWYACVVFMVIGFVLAAVLGPTRQTDTHLLWKATRGSSTLYILGVSHAVPVEISKIPVHVMRAFDASSSYATESYGVFVNNFEPDAARLKRLEKRPPGSEAPPRAWHFLNQMVSDGDIRPEQALELSKASLYGLTSFFRQQTEWDWYRLATKGQHTPMAQGLDHQLAVIAKAKNKLTFGLEDVVARQEFWNSECGDEKYYLEYLESIMQLQKKFATVSDFKKFTLQIYAGEYETFTKEYYQLMAYAAATRIEFDCSVIPRNKNWVEMIMSLSAAQTKAFIAVGAAHVIGQDSVQNLLMQRGYKIERVWR
jgi:uncharacterized protein